MKVNPSLTFLSTEHRYMPCLGNIIGNSAKAREIINSVETIAPPLFNRIMMWQRSDPREAVLGLPTILITGAGRGLGLELATQFTAAGWETLGTVRDLAKGAAMPRGTIETRCTGSLPGTSELDATTVWPLDSKKSRKMVRMSATETDGTVSEGLRKAGPKRRG